MQMNSSWTHTVYIVSIQLRLSLYIQDCCLLGCSSLLTCFIYSGCDYLLLLFAQQWSPLTWPSSSLLQWCSRSRSHRCHWIHDLQNKERWGTHWKSFSFVFFSTLILHFELMFWCTEGHICFCSSYIMLNASLLLENTIISQFLCYWRFTHRYIHVPLFRIDLVFWIKYIFYWNNLHF